MKKKTVISDIGVEEEKKANKYNVKCILVTMILSLCVLLGNELEIFIMYKPLCRTVFILMNAILLVLVIVAKVTGYKFRGLKYVLLGGYVLVITIIATLLTYHGTLFWGLPFIMASYYREKKMAIYVYVCTAIGIAISVFGGYRYGIADMNFIALTTNSVSNWGENMQVYVSPLNGEMAVKLFTFFVIPRWMISLIYSNMGLAVVDSVAKIEKSKRDMEYENTHDIMTGLYNKKQYKTMKNEVYYNMKNIGIMFFDINNLKDINDKLGHDKGDELIEMAADSISYIQSSRIKVYRVGGDEFIAIIEEPREGEMDSLVVRWERALDMVNRDKEDIKCSMALGTAEGKGSEIDILYRIADEEMYANKAMIKLKLNK